MNHVKLRRFALAAASVSIGALTTLVMIGTAVIGDLQTVSAQDICFGGAETQSIETQEQMTPIPISCTPLVIKNLSAYDGNFMEDGSGREVQDVAAVMLYNSRDTVVPYAFVTVYTEHCRFTFQAYMIPPRSSVLVPEENAQKLTESEIIRTFGWTTVKEESKEIRLDIEEIGLGCLRITNESGSKIHDLTIYHRTYIPQDGFYMGGKAFKTQISYMAPGESMLIYPSNYAAGYSRIVCYE